MTTYYWAGTCSNCKQGRLLILRNLTDGELYLHCEECEVGWRDPATASDPSAGFLTLDEEFETAFPTLSEIRKRGWEPYVKGTFDQ